MKNYCDLEAVKTITLDRTLFQRMREFLRKGIEWEEWYDGPDELIAELDLAESEYLAHVELEEKKKRYIHLVVEEDITEEEEEELCSLQKLLYSPK